MSRGVLFHPLWNHLNQMQGDLNRAFDRWVGGALAGTDSNLVPPVNLWEENDQVFVEAELPGLDQNSLELFVTGGNQLTIKGERKVNALEKGLRHRQERQAGSFSRTLTLPFLVDQEKVEAKLDNGVLLVRLSKHESAKPRKIPVNAQ
jgi:HSP20 family protein